MKKMKKGMYMLGLLLMLVFASAVSAFAYSGDTTITVTTQRGWGSRYIKIKNTPAKYRIEYRIWGRTKYKIKKSYAEYKVYVNGNYNKRLSKSGTTKITLPKGRQCTIHLVPSNGNILEGVWNNNIGFRSQQCIQHHSLDIVQYKLE